MNPVSKYPVAKTRAMSLFGLKRFVHRPKPQPEKRRTASSPSTDKQIAITSILFESARTITPEASSERSSTPRSAWHCMSTSFTSHREKNALNIISPQERVIKLKPSGLSTKEGQSPIPFDPGSGAAAKASVAAQKRDLDDELTNTRSRSETLPRYEAVDPHKSITLGQSLTKDTESGIDLRQDNGDAEGSTIPVVRKGKSSQTQKNDTRSPLNIDPFDILPPEITSAILSYLDAASLASTERVSSKWFGTASQRHAWRQAFQNDVRSATQNALVPTNKPPTYGLGLGKLLPDQDWKTMLKARKELQSRWRKGQAAAVYLEGHTDSVYCVQFDEYVDYPGRFCCIKLNLNRNKIITGSRDQTVRVWDAKTYRCIKMLGVPNRSSVHRRPSMQGESPGQPGRPTTVRVSDAGNTRSNDLRAEFRHTGSILCLQFDENIMVTGSSDKTCIIWDLDTDYQPVRRLRSHNAGVLDVCFDDKHIVSCSKDTSICLWDRNTGERLRRMTGHRGPVNAVQLRGDLIVSASGDGVAKLWNLTSGLCIKEFASRDRGMACVDFSLDSRTILAGGNDQVVYQFDTNSGELTREMKGHQGLVRSLHLDNANGRIVSGSYDTSVRAYDLVTGELIVAFAAWTTSWILSAKADYRRIVAASQDSRTVVMDFGHGVPGIELLAA